MHKRAIILCGLLAIWFLSGCSAAITSLKYRNLDVQTRMSETIFLEPIPLAQRTVWLDVKSTADRSLDLAAIRETLTARGYRVVEDPMRAHYHLQVHVLYVGEASQAAIDQAYGYGYGGPLGGAAAGATAGILLGGSQAALAGGLIGGLLAAGAETVAGSLVKVKTWSIITDLQISERSAAPVAQLQRALLKQGTQTDVSQEVSETSTWKRYRTRVVSTAVKTNLKFEDAKSALEEGITKAVGGLL